MIPLATHSHYSLLRGTASPAALCEAARRLGYRQLALTDRNNLYGLIRFLAACRQQGLRPIIGAELTQPANETAAESFGDGRAFLLVENREGYRNLCRIVSARHLDPAFNLEQAVLTHRQGLLPLTPDPALLKSWQAAELPVHAALAGGMNSANYHLYRLARSLERPAVAVPDSFFLQPEEEKVHRLLRAIAHTTTLSALPAHSCCPADRWLAPAAFYAKRFAAWPELLASSHAVAERCSLQDPDFGLVMPPYDGSGRRTATETLKRMAFAGARRRYGTPLPAAVKNRLLEELAIIERMHFSTYFLAVRAMVPREARTCGRGSAAASLVSYSLGLTNVCPVKHKLYFARFLNPGRKDPPDIDIDFAWDERDAIIAEVLRRHGDHAAMVSSHILLQPRMAIRECAKIFGIAEAEIKRVTGRLPWLWRRQQTDEDFFEQIRRIPNLRDFHFAPPWPEIIGLARRIIGIPRHLSVHPGGLVITPGPVRDYVPVERAAKGVPIIQWDKDAAEDAGLVKIDLLGNRSLAVIRDAIANLRQNGASLDETCWQPEDDAATQKTVAKGRTMGCFYIESPAMRLLQEKAGRGDFAHLVIHSSIIRPAANEFIREYVRRLHGGDWQPLHPLLADVLQETFGIMAYQEDVSRVAEALAGFSAAEADGLRKVLSKKDRILRLQDYERKFVAGCRRNGLKIEQIARIWQMMLSFDGYSFCKPHSASYAKVSFQAAWLKTHFPAEFMAAVISNGGGYYSTFAYISEARRLGLSIRRPNVRTSSIRWTGRDRSLQAGLLAVRDLARQTMQRIVDEREKRPFSSLVDFCRRVRPSVEEVRSLIDAGTLDGLENGGQRAALHWQLASLEKQLSVPADPLFTATPPVPPLPPEPPLIRLRREFQALGFLADFHPLRLFAGHPQRDGTIAAAALKHHIGRRIKTAGWLITGKTVSTKHGETMEFITFEDESALLETIFFPQVYRKFCHLLRSNHPYILEGRVEEDYGAVTLRVNGLQRLK